MKEKLETMASKAKLGFVVMATALSLYGCGTTRNCPSTPNIGKRVIAEVKKEKCGYGEMMLGYCYDGYSAPMAFYGD